MRLPRELVFSRYLSFARARPPLVPKVLRTVATRGTWGGGTQRSGGDRSVSTWRFGTPPARLLPASFSPSGGPRPTPLPEGRLWLGGRALSTVRRVSPDAEVGASWRDGPLGRRGRPLGKPGMAPRGTGRLSTPGGPLVTPDGLPPSGARTAPLTHRVRSSFSPGPLAKGSGSRQPLEGVFLTLSTPRAASVRAASFRGVPQPGLLAESGRLGPSAPFSSRSLPTPGYCFVGECSSFFAQI